jgi:hypothetical protein
MLNELQDFDLKLFLLWAFQNDIVMFQQRDERLKRSKPV